MMNDGGAKTETLLRVAEIEGRGRSLVAAQPLRSGQVILRESPLLLYSAFPFLSSLPSPYCDHCFRQLSQSSQRCQSCSLVSFCSPNCISFHTPWLCESLRRLHQSSSSSAAFADQSPERQVQARFLLSAYNLAAASPPDFQILLSLQGGGELNGDRSDSELLHSLLSAVCPPLPVPISPELTAALLEKDKVNGFGLMEPFSSVASEKRSVRAYGIYPKASFLNHDCLPNACRFDYVDSASDGNNTDIIIRMIHDVPQGREVCLSYFPVNMNYSSRQKRLLEDYGFRCECDRCKVESNWSEDENEDMEEMDGGEDDQEEEEEMEEGEGCGDGVDDESSFPHAYFFARYMCEKENCFGTLAPLPPKGHDVSRFLECNVCGSVKEDEVVGNP